MTTSINVHDTVKLRKLVKHHDTFSCYTFIGTNKNGHDTEVTFFHTKGDPMSISDNEILDFTGEK
jgi:hypothetical protein